MATGETGFDDVSFDLISLQYHSLKAGHDYGQYVRDARNAGREDIRAVLPTPAERELLAVDAGVAAFSVERLGRVGDEAVEWRHTLVRGDRYTLTADLGAGEGHHLALAR